MYDYGLSWAQFQHDMEEPPMGKVVGTCALCGRDVFEGEKIYRIDGDWYCTDCVTEDEATEDEPFDEY